MTKKCENCKFGNNAWCAYPQYDKTHKHIDRTFKYTTNSKDFTHCDKHEFDKKINGKFHPCTCTDYNGSQCYNCLNGFHEGCTDKCNKKNSKHMGVKLIFK